jgi:predicted RNase H-like nuclease (RuvC/YqgF family)
MVEIGHWSRPTKRQESKSAISLVDCTVRVSPTLARLIRKCAATETGGASAHDALLASAGVRAGEIEALREQDGQCAQELSQAREHAAQLQRALDHAQSIIAQHDKELDDLRREMIKAAETGKGSRNSITALKVRVGELQMKVSNHEVHLKDYLATDGLDEAAVMALKALSDGLRRGENIEAMVLSNAGYSLGDIEAAMSKHDRAEIRAFETLLARPTWRRRVVLWLLRSPPLK